MADRAPYFPAPLDSGTGTDLDPLSQQLALQGSVSSAQADEAVRMAQRLDLPVRQVYARCFSLSDRVLSLAERALLDTRLVNPLTERADPALVRAFDPAACLRAGVLPWRRIGGSVVVLASDEERFRRAEPALRACFGPVRLALAIPDQLTQALSRDHAARLVEHAETRLPAADSSRGWSSARTRRLGVAAALAGIAALTAWPVGTVVAVCTLAVAMLALSAALKGAAMIAALTASTDDSVGPATLPRALPVITLLVPLYQEREIADHLVTRLEALDYPRECLDVILILEDDDRTTRAALGRTRMLTWMRAVTVPRGTLKTKPRALNYALDFARGSIVGVYDAEDAPDPAQLLVVADRFARAAPDVACLQGVLDYYNSTANWLTRCFTVEYAGWFRVVLPGIARMGLVVPLGGTTLFFRREILDRLGGWDAHNVTEDADLGIRLARRGFRTEFIPTVTLEEANGRYWPWVKQRSRWLKGYAVTWAVHMRAPRRTLAELGAWRFAGLQVLFLGTLAQFTLAPVLWSFWLILAGLPHPLTQVLTPPVWTALVALFLASEAINLAVAALGLSRAHKGRLIPWALTLQAYFPLGSLAVYKGLLELAWKPFWWDKTVHGVLLPGSAPAPSPTPDRGLALPAVAITAPVARRASGA